MTSICLQWSKQGPDKIYATIIESFYDPVRGKNTSKKLEYYGNVAERLKEDPHLKEKLKARVDEIKNNGELYKKLQSKNPSPIKASVPIIQDEPTFSSPQFLYGSAVIYQVWDMLGLRKWFRKARFNHGIKYNFELAIFYIVCSRILSIGLSRRSMARLAPSHLFTYDNIELKELYDTLKNCSLLKSSILDALHKGVNNIIKRDCSLVFYDVTTFYFESHDPDNLRKRGMSKEHRTHETQVVLGLLIDSNGIPCAYELYPGNTAEVNTLIEVVRAFRSRHPTGKCVLVADKGLNSKENLSKLKKEGCEYIVAHSLERLKKTDYELLFSEDNWKVNFNDNGEITWKIKEIPVRYVKLDKEQEYDYNDRLICTWSYSRYLNDIKEITQKYEKAKLLLNDNKGNIEHSFTKGARQFLRFSKETKEKMKYELNTELYEKQKARAGYYAFITNRVDCCCEQAYHDLRQLWIIEDNFRLMKSLLESRPVFVWTEDNVRGHFVTCILSLTVERVMLKLLKDKGLNYSAYTISELLRCLNVVPVYGTSSAQPLLMKTTQYQLREPENHQSESEPVDKEAEKILEALGLTSLNTLESVSTAFQKLGGKLKIRAIPGMSPANLDQSQTSI